MWGGNAAEATQRAGSPSQGSDISARHRLLDLLGFGSSRRLSKGLGRFSKSSETLHVQVQSAYRKAVAMLRSLIQDAYLLLTWTFAPPKVLSSNLSLQQPA